MRLRAATEQAVVLQQLFIRRFSSLETTDIEVTPTSLQMRVTDSRILDIEVQYCIPSPRLFSETVDRSEM